MWSIESLDIYILNRPFKGHFMNGGFVIPALVLRRLNRRSSKVGARNIVLNDAD